MNKYLAHFMTITKHKYYVAQECFKCGLYWQGLVHDLSKYSPTEFFSSARYFQGDKSPIEAEKAEKNYSEAWLHHKGRNKHHWEYWVDWTHGELQLADMPEKYLKEMACDIIGASKAYAAAGADRDEPLEFFRENSKGWLMTGRNKEIVEACLMTYSFMGRVV
jgi:hypothetical protein